nr:DciA family protein [uncultured Sphingorhabdus sp.]
MDESMDKGKSATPPKGTKKALTPKTFQRPRGGEARAVSALMPDIGRAAFRRFGFVQSSVVSRWDEIVGARYAAVSAPEAIRFPVGKKSDGTLELTVEGAHATMIQHVLPEIMDRVNRFFGYGAVARVKVRQGPVSKPKPRQPSPPPMLKPVPMELGESLREIGDPELFAVLESLAKSLAKGGE